MANVYLKSPNAKIKVWGVNFDANIVKWQLKHHFFIKLVKQTMLHSCFSVIIRPKNVIIVYMAVSR